jgi:hypothetical protein
VEFRDLLQYWSDWLSTHQHTHLAIFTSEPSHSYATIAHLAEKLEPFDLWTAPAVSEPDVAVTNGVYADQVYF